MIVVVCTKLAANVVEITWELENTGFVWNTKVLVGKISVDDSAGMDVGSKAVELSRTKGVSTEVSIGTEMTVGKDKMKVDEDPVSSVGNKVVVPGIS